MKTRIFLLLTIVFFFSLQNCSLFQRKDALLTLNGDFVSTDEFFTYESEYYFSLLEDADKIDKVNSFVDKEILLYDARQKGYADRPDILESVNEFSKTSKIRILLDRTILDTVITEDMMRTTYNNSSEAWKSTHPFEEEKRRIRDKLANMHRSRLQNAYYQFIEETIFNFGVYYHLDTIDSISTAYAELRQQWNAEERQYSALDVLDSIPYDAALVTYTSGSLEKSDLVAELRKFPKRVPPSLQRPDVLKSLVEAILIQQLFLKLADEKAIADDSEYIRVTHRFQKERILSEYTKEQIYQQISYDDESLFSFYEDRKDSLYSTKPKAEVQEIFVKDRPLAERILERVQNGDDFTSLADEFTTRYQDKAKPGYLGYITENQYAGIGKAAIRCEPNSVYPEVIPSGKGFSVIRVLDYQQPVPKSYEKVKGTVRSDYTNFNKKTRRQELIRDLKEKYNARIHWENLEIQNQN